MLINRDHRQHYQENNSMFMKTRDKFTQIPKNQNLWMNDEKQSGSCG